MHSEMYENDLSLIISSIPDYTSLFKKSILITGSNGLICSAIVDFLMFLNIRHDAKIDVYASGRNLTKLKNRFCTYTENRYLHLLAYDVMDPLELNDEVDYIIHGASPANPGQYGKIPVETMLINIEGTNNVLKFARDNKVKRLLYISSSEVYGKKNDGKKYSEDDYSYVDVLNPRACYPCAKRACETLCAAYGSEYEVDSVIVRPGHVYGPTMTEKDNRASSQFPKDILEGRDIVMKSRGEQLRSYCYVLDCVSAILTVLLKGTTGEAYNISNKNSVVTIREMAEAFAKAGQKKVVFELPTEDEKRSYNLMDNSSLDATKLELLGWKGLFDLKTGTKHTLEIIKEIIC